MEDPGSKDSLFSGDSEDYKISIIDDEVFQIEFDEFDDLVDRNQHLSKEMRKLSLATGLCFCFFLVELIFGLISGSVAIKSDAYHLLTDIFSFVISLLSMKISTWPSTRKYNFGYHRVEAIGAFFSIVFIYIATSFLVVEAIEHLKHPEKIDSLIMVVVASVGVVVNIVLGKTLHSFSGFFSHDHSHGDESNCKGHSHPHDQLSGSSHNNHASHHHSNINISAAFIHVLGDLISSIGVLISSLLIWGYELRYKEDDDPNFINPFLIADPICTFIFSAIVLVTTIPLLKRFFFIFVEGNPGHIDKNELVDIILEETGCLVHAHSLKIWSLSSGNHAMALTLIPKIGVFEYQIKSVIENSSLSSDCKVNDYSKAFIIWQRDLVIKVKKRIFLRYRINPEFCFVSVGFPAPK